MMPVRWPVQSFVQTLRRLQVKLIGRLGGDQLPHRPLQGNRRVAEIVFLPFAVTCRRGRSTAGPFHYNTSSLPSTAAEGVVQAGRLRSYALAGRARFTSASAASDLPVEGCHPCPIT